MSLAEIVVNLPLRLTLVTAIASSSYFFLGNLGSAYCGIVPAIQDPSIVHKIPLATKVELWKWFYDRAKYHFVTAASISAVSFARAAYLTSSPILTTLFAVAAACSFTIMPFTALAMLSTNNWLSRMHTSGALGNDVSVAMSNEVAQRIETWARLHRVRMVLGGTAWVLGLSAVAVSF